MRRGRRFFSKLRFVVPLILLVFVMILAGHALVNAPVNELSMQQLNIQQAPVSLLFICSMGKLPP